MASLDLVSTRSSLTLCVVVLCLFHVVGQRYVPNSGRKEPDEHSGVHRQSLLRCIYQVPEEQRHGGSQFASHLLENESPGEEASGEKREAGRRPNQQSEKILSQEACEPCAGPERV